MMLPTRLSWRVGCALGLGLTAWLATRATAAERSPCVRTIEAEVVALDQPLTLNRLGSHVSTGMIYALKEDVVSSDPADKSGTLQPGKVMLRPGKRPRPLVLRMNVGDCLKIHFTNLLSTSLGGPNGAQTRYAGLHINGVDLVPSAPTATDGISSDGSWVGKNNPGKPGSLTPPLPAPGGKIDYTVYAKAEGTFLIFSGADNSGTVPPSGQPSQGLFGALNVQPDRAEWYRSQVTREDLFEATLKMADEFRVAAMALPAGQEQAIGGPGPSAAKPLNNRLLRLLPSRATPPPGAEPPPAVHAQALAVQVGRRVMQRFALLSVIPDKHAEIVTDVLRDPQGRLYSLEGHPLIDYDSVYGDGNPRAGLPVLKMLRTSPVGAALFTINLTPEQFDRAQVGLVSANSYITAEVSDQFKAHGKTLTDRVRISDAEGRDAWLLTEPGLGLYLVEQLAGRRGFTVFTASLKLVHSDLTAIITGPRAGRFAFSENSPTFFNNPALPDRRQPYREFTIIYHFLPATVQAFDQFGAASTSNAFAAGLDQYGINYGVAAIGPEVIANRMGVGPMGNADAVDLKFEEFFLSSWAVGDPAMIVDVPAGDLA